ncbi:hypothetical protein DY000_02029317 [Brassica cretica]|uniref:Uncharacterized protein n=1 Tax=Brassica cretica TaxID=69181 RepID=A0ABQ7DUV3_BRACR|nr:hypothetical protein DY000_02029317 [Brassica cretica]
MESDGVVTKLCVGVTCSLVSVVEALTQGKFSKDGFIEEVWKDCSCVKTVSSGAAGWDLCLHV